MLRKMFMTLCSIGFVLSLPLSPAIASELPIEERCDIPGASLSSHSEIDPKACRDSCANQPACGGFVHISGWNRCFLKSKPVKTKLTLRFYAGHISLDKDGRRTASDAAFDRDYSGKDLRNVTGLKDGPSCGEACINEPKCAAFVYMQGYGNCWLKTAKGSSMTKIFSCGRREA